MWYKVVLKKGYTFRKVSLFFFILFSFSCETKDRQAEADKWYNETKAAIFKQSDLKADSIDKQFNKDSTYRTEYSYFRNHLFLKRGFNHDRLVLETYYSSNSEFELRREVCTNGKVGFEGIFYKDKSYGSSTWGYCNGQLQEQGIRFNTDKIGIWKKWNDTGKLIEEKDYKNIEKVDSLPLIAK